MVEWLSNTLDMRFYYWTGLSWLFLLPVYIVGAGLITLLWWRLAKRVKRAWAIIVPLYLVLAIGPWVEELWIAWNFGHLCKKDAGIFIYKTVEVEGFYDTTAGLREIYKPLPEVTSKSFDERGYRFYEMSLADTKGGPTKVAHFEKIKGEWVGKVLDRPTARYHYMGNRYGINVVHGIQKFEDLVIDTQSDDVLGKYLIYYRDAPWFFIGLDRPTVPCRETQEATRTHGSLIYRSVLKPQKQ
jgi:hypothetical protein